MDIVLQTQKTDPYFAFHDVGRFGDGSGFRVRLVVRSHGFSCDRPFYFEVPALDAFLNSLTRMDKNLTGSAEIGLLHEPDLITFSVDQTGRVAVVGHLFEFGEHDHELRFGFTTDQTCLHPLIAALNVLAERVRQPAKNAGAV